MQGKQSNNSQVNSILIVATLLFGINPIVIKLGITEMSPMIFTTLRLFVAVLAFGLFLTFSKTKIPLEKKDIFVFFKMGLAASVFQLGMIMALKYVSAGIVATMIGLIPISTLIIHRFKGVRMIMNYHYYGTLMTFFGVFLVSGLIGGPVNIRSTNAIIGIGLLLLAQFAAASYMVLSEDMLKTYSHYQVSTTMFFITFVMFLIMTLPELVTKGVGEISGAAFFCIIYGGVVSLCIANNLWIWGIKKIGSHKAVIFNNLPPVFALVAGMLFLNEIPMPSQVIGVVAVLFGLYVFSGKWARVNG